MARLVSSSTRGTRIRDQERSPIAADFKRIMREKTTIGEKTFAFDSGRIGGSPTDPNRAVRLEGSLAVKSRRGAVYVNTVGTSGCRRRLIGGPVQRQPWAASRNTSWARQREHSISSSRTTSLEAGGAAYRQALFSFFVLCTVAAVPLSWSKTTRW